MVAAGKEADGGKTDVGEVTNAPESPGGKIHSANSKIRYDCVVHTRDLVI